METAAFKVASEPENDNKPDVATAAPAEIITDYSQTGDIPPFLDVKRYAERDKFANLTVLCEAIKKEKGAKGGKPNWIRDWKETANGDKYPAKTDRNIRAFLNYHGIALRRNEFTHRVDVEGYPHERTLNDRIVRAVTTKMRLDGCEIKQADVMRVLEVEGDNHRYNPLRDYVGGLKWDGVERLATVLIDCLGVEDTPLTRAMTIAWFVGAVKRLFYPGCQHDYVLALIGDEGFRKSAFFNILGYTTFYSSSLPVGAADKRVIEDATGKWIVELKELSGMTKHDNTEILTFIDRRRDIGTLKWEKFGSEYLRSFVFGASTNVWTPLTSIHGNRRWWLAYCSKQVDEKALLGMRVQLWAEAVHLMRAGAPNYLAADMEEKAREVQAAAVQRSPIYETLERLGLKDHKGTLPASEVYAALGIEKPRNPLTLKKQDKAEIETALHALGWRRSNGSLDIQANVPKGGGVEIVHCWRRGFTKDRSAVKFGAPSVLMWRGAGFVAVHAGEYIGAEQARDDADRHTQAMKERDIR
jgi:putative DNA primase/helicase